MSGVDLVTFLRARLDEREAAAKAVEVPEDWTSPRWFEDVDAEFIALNDPAFVLADVAAKRRILSDVYEPLRELESAIQDENDTGEDPSINWHEVSDRLLCALAAPFTQHPDFDPAWAVAGERS